VSPSGVLLPAHPYPVRIGRLADNQSGAVQPVSALETPTIPRLLNEARSLSLAVASVGRKAREYARDSSLFSHKQTKTAIGEHERRSAAPSPSLKPGVSAAHI
jgi:hypothetical protein